MLLFPSEDTYLLGNFKEPTYPIGYKWFIKIKISIIILSSVRQTIEQGLLPRRSRVHTITYDNGLEFAEHQKMAQTRSANIYFAHPYSSWERGENTNGLIRQYLPKSQPLNNVTMKKRGYIMDQLNHRARKTLGFKTPLFFKK